MSKCCIVLFLVLGILAFINAIVTNLIAYLTCWYMTPYNVNTNQYGHGFYKYCCKYHGASALQCLPMYTIYNGASIAGIAISWGLCLMFFILALFCWRRSKKRQME